MLISHILSSRRYHSTNIDVSNRDITSSMSMIQMTENCFWQLTGAK
jgi:hypothetical protein